MISKARTPSTRSRWRSLPPDLLQQSCKRVAIMSLIFASLWTIALVMNNIVAPLLGHNHMLNKNMAWPFPGTLISSIGLAISLATFLLVGRLKGTPHVLLNVSHASMILGAGLVAILMHWFPAIETSRVSWLCLIIVAYPSIVPTPPLKTLYISLVVASMDPFAIWLAHLRGVSFHADAFAMTWHILPNYISVGLAMIPSTMIAGLGRQVSRARELGSYQLGELLGRGGMGEVYHARHRMLARPAAIKLIRPEALGAGTSDAAQVVIQRFRREAQAAAVLRSPHTISLYDFGVTDDGVFYYVMELLEGLDLESLVRRFGPVPAARASFLLRHACHSLGEAHARGLIHRDIKPSNIFTCRLGLSVDFVKVLDFGLVKHHAEGAHAQTVLLTQPDVTTGTPAYMAPEMALGERTIDRRVDIYALGCVGYWLLTGRLVFEADTPVKMMLQHIQAVPAPPSRYAEQDVPPELDQIILRCLAKNPDDRPADTMLLAAMLNGVNLPEPWTKDRAEQWWETHLPATAPFTEVREKTPIGMVAGVR
jgi:serine/threonine-protein kinase